MVSFERERPDGGPVIQGFSGRGFRVDGTVYEDGLWLTPELAQPWRAPPIGDLRAEDVTDLLKGSPPPEFLLLGTGATMRRPAVAFVTAIEALGFGIEAMDSHAAARAWVVLRGEGRNIVAALLPL